MRSKKYKIKECKHLEVDLHTSREYDWDGQTIWIISKRCRKCGNVGYKEIKNGEVLEEEDWIEE